jgi:hypothetical protein
MPVIIQSALHPAGPQAASISSLWWLIATSNAPMTTT